MPIKARGVHFYRPQTSTELTQQARQFPYDPKASFSSWLRYAEAVKKQADGYMQHGEEQYAFLLYKRCEILIREMLPSHPEAGQNRGNEKGLARARAAANDVVPIMEAMLPSIDRRARHFSDAGRNQEQQTATEVGMPEPSKKKRKRKPFSISESFGIPKNHY